MQVNGKKEKAVELEDFDIYAATRRKDTSLQFKEDLFTDTPNHYIEVKAPFFKDMKESNQIYFLGIFLVETREDLTFEQFL